MRRMTSGSLAALALVAIAAPTAKGQQSVSAPEARQIAREAYIYGFPIVDNYRIIHSYAIDKANREYKAPINQIASEARVYTPDDKAVQTPNSDTPYSFLVADLRAEPLVLTIPAVEKNRYYSVQLIDLYTFNFEYLGSRTTGVDGSRVLLAGPGWRGNLPAGVNRIVRSETEIVLAIYRTQLFNPGDIATVKKIQEGYKVEPLSTYLNQPAPKAASAIEFAKPLTAEEQRTSLGFFNILSFALQFCPVNPTEAVLRGRFRRIGIEPGKPFNAAAMPANMQAALKAGMTDGQKEIDARRATTRSSANIFGTRDFLKNNYVNRAVAAQMGIYGNSKEEAYYAGWSTEADGKTSLNTASNRYVIRFARGQIPPVNAFWSVTMYDMPAQLLVANKINRYLINSAMLSRLRRNKDGSITLYVQKDPPGAKEESNWLPAPDGDAYIILRAYWPKPPILDGKWKLPKIERVE
jgi:hypothetical protein